MDKERAINPSQEYETLRQELLESKRYVFERPLVVAALGVAGLGTMEIDRIALLPMLMAGFLLFNYLFTKNRLTSAARIVAYIQLVLEGENLTRWKGWETSLRDYRIWMNKNKGNEKKIWSQIPEDASPKALMYYTAIYQLHWALVVLTVVMSIAVLFVKPNGLSIFCTVLTLLFFWFFRKESSGKSAPRNMRKLIELNLVIWKEVLVLGPAPSTPHGNSDNPT